MSDNNLKHSHKWDEFYDMWICSYCGKTISKLKKGNVRSNKFLDRYEHFKNEWGDFIFDMFIFIVMAACILWIFGVIFISIVSLFMS